MQEGGVRKPRLPTNGPVAVSGLTAAFGWPGPLAGPGSKVGTDLRPECLHPVADDGRDRHFGSSAGEFIGEHFDLCAQFGAGPKSDRARDAQL